MELRYLNFEDKSAWDGLVKASVCSGFMQSWEWSRFKEEAGQRVFRLGIMDGNVLIGGAIVYAVESSLGTSPLIIPHGPVLPWDRTDLAQEALRFLLKEFNVIARDLGAPALRVEPVVSAETMARYFPEAKRAPIDLIPTPSLLIDIARPDQEILAGMKPKGRYNIKQAAKQGVETSCGVSMDLLEEFYALFELTCVRHRFTGENLEFFQSLMQHLSVEKMARIYLTRYRGVLTSAAIVVFYGPTATYLYGGSLPFFPRSMSSYDLHWRAMRDAREEGCRYYDFYGIAPKDNPRHPYARFTAFKKKFGGRLTTNTGAHDMIFYEQLSDLWLKQMDEMLVS